MPVTENTEAIWLQLNNKLYAFILGKVHDNAVAKDILHDVYIRMHTSIVTLKDDTKVQSWIYQIARNLIIDYYRTAKTKQNTTSAVD